MRLRLAVPCLPALLLGTLFLCANLATAQEPEPPAAPKEAPAAAPETPADPPAEEAPAVATPPEAAPLERLIYLPYKNLREVFEKQGATVFMPYAQFLKLWQEKHPVAAELAPPVGAVISSANYVGRIENNLARIDATFKVRVLAKSWTEVPLKFGDAAVGKMTTDNEQVLLRGTGEGTYSLLLPAAGEYTVTLELVSRIKTSTEGRSFELEVPTVGITTLDLAIPAPDQTVEVTPHLVSAPAEADANSTKITASVGATNRLSARWYPRVSDTPEMELLASVTSGIVVRVADGLVHTDATLTYQILRGQLNQVQIAVPLGHRILDVAAANLKGWKAAEEANRQVITVDLLSESSKTVTVDIRTERPLGTEPAELAGIAEDGTVHGIHAVGAVRESGVLVVNHAPDVTLGIDEQQGLVRVEANDVPESFRRPEGLYYKFYSPAFRLLASVKPVEPRLLVEQRSRVEFQEDELRLTSDFVYTIERAGVFELRYQLPPDLKVDTVDCEQKKEFSVSEDGKTLLVTLNQKTQGQVHVRIAGRRPLPETPEEAFSLPIIEPLNVTRETGFVQIYAPEAVEVITEETGLLAAQPDRAANAESLPNLRLVSAWTYNRRPVEIPVRTVRKPARLTADVGTVVNIKQELAEVVTRLNYNVQYAGIDTFRFDVPEALAEQIEIEIVPEDNGPAIKQRTTEGESHDGWVTRVVVLQREVLGRQRFVLKYDLKTTQDAGIATVLINPIRVLGIADDEATEPPAAEEGADAVATPSPAATVPTLRLGEIAVQKDRSLSIAAVPRDLEPIDVRELEVLPNEGYLAFRYTRQPAQLELKATKPDLQEVVQTVVSRALVEAVVSQDGTVTYRCRYRLQTSERQRLPVGLPTGAELLGTLVAGKQVSLERNIEAAAVKGMDIYALNVSRPGRSDEPFYVTLLFRLQTATFSTNRWVMGSSLSLPLPQLGGGSPTQSVAIQQLRVAVWVPEEFALVGTPDHFTLDYRRPIEDVLLGRGQGTTQTGWLEDWIGNDGSSLFDFPKLGTAFVYSNLGGAAQVDVDWWRTSVVTWIWSGAIFLIGWILVRTSWENKLGILLLACFVAALYALEDPETTLYFLSACLYGLAAMLVYWLIYALTHLPARPKTVPPSPPPVQPPPPPSSPPSSPPGTPPADPASLILSP